MRLQQCRGREKGDASPLVSKIIHMDRIKSSFVDPLVGAHFRASCQEDILFSEYSVIRSATFRCFVASVIDECYRVTLARILRLANGSPKSSRRRRDSLSIMAEILEVAREGALKTQIMYKANLSFVQVNEYLSLLLSLKLLNVSKTPRRTVYKTTAKGHQYLQSYKEIKQLLKQGRKGNNKKEADSLYLVKRGTRVILL